MLTKYQNASIEELSRKLKVEEDAMKTLKMDDEERIEHEARRDEEEGVWISQIPNLDVQVKQVSSELDRIGPAYRQGKLTVNNNKMLLDIQYQSAQVALQAIEKFDRRSVLMQQLLLSIFKALYSFRQKIEAKFNAFERNESWKVSA